MDIFNFDQTVFLGFLLTLIRVSLLVFLLPFFNSDFIPTMVKAGMCLVVTLCIYPKLGFHLSKVQPSGVDIALFVGSELVLGLAMGLIVNFVFAGLQTGGQLIGFQMGFSMISIADPSSGQQLIITSMLVQLIAMMLFLTMDGHLYILSALAESFKLIPAGELVLNPPGVVDLLELSGSMFSIAIKIAGPIVVCLFMIDLALALMAKAAPQMNLLIIGFPIKIAIGLTLFGSLMVLVGAYLEEFISGMGPMFYNILSTMRMKG